MIDGRIVRRKLSDLADEYNITIPNYYYYINKHKVLRDKFDELKTTRKLIL
jgi:hypothetical protein